jgi:peptide/nickel transport system substrate-binding protein
MNGAKLNYYADNASLALAIQAGAIDVYLDMPYQGSQALFHNSNIHIFKTPGSTYREFHMRVDKKPFNDKRVRQAVALSLDRPAIIKGVLGGYGTLGNDHLFAPAFQSSALAVKNIPQRKQNIAQAKKLLAAAGHPNGIDVTLTTEQFLEIPQYAVFAQQQLKKAGIRVHLNIEDQNTYYGTGSNQPWLDVDMGIVDWAPRGSPSQLISVAYLCSNLPAPPGWNSAHWCNRTFTHLMAEYDATLNLAKKRQIAYQAAKIMHDEVPAIVAYWFIELRGIRKNVHGIAPGPAAHLDPSPIWLSS